jgi:hypothetical protein
MYKIFAMLAIGLVCSASSDVKKVKLVEPINLGGVHLFTVRGVNATQRSEIIYDRLRNVLVPSLQASDIEVAKIKGQAVILVHDEILMTVTSEDAKLNKTDRFNLAFKLQNRLSKLLPELVPFQ